MSTPQSSQSKKPIQIQIQEALRTNTIKPDLIKKVSTYKVMTEKNKKTLAKDLSDGLGAILNNQPSTAETTAQEAKPEAKTETESKTETEAKTDA